MEVQLGPALDNFVSSLMQSGNYESRGEILREGLRLLKEREEMTGTPIGELRSQIAAGTQQADQGLLADGQEAFARIRLRRGSVQRGE